MNRISLDGRWKLKEAPLSYTGITGLKKINEAENKWIEAKVPGEVHLDLIRSGQMEEPLISLNARRSRWPEKRSWWFVRTFQVSSRFLENEHQNMVFEGLDFYAQVFLNGEKLGETDNSFIPWTFDVRHRLKTGTNKIAVRLTAGGERVSEELRPAEPKDGAPYSSRMKFPGISRLRKPQFTYGWDWVEALPNIGIWRGVYLEGKSYFLIHDLSFDTLMMEEKVFLDCRLILRNIHPWKEREGSMELVIKPPRGEDILRRIDFKARTGQTELNFEIDIPEPCLWWPNGTGKQPLYSTETKIFHGNKLCDSRKTQIGLRTVEINRSKTGDSSSHFCIRVNGHDIFCRGGNWIPADGIIARVSRKKYETLIGEARDANINMLRVWGGGIYESSDFYNACDRSGILVWQDFMFACSEYPDHEKEFLNTVREEAEKIIKQLRHHPSIALWCGNNENLWGFESWWNKGRKYGDRDFRTGGSRIYSLLLPEICRTLDPCRSYWPGSPAGGDHPNSETEGDCHWWDPFTMNKDINRRITHEVFDKCRARFVSEYGVIGACHLSSIKKYLRREELFVGSGAWKEHTNSFEKETTPAGIKLHYADPEELSVSDYILYSQMFQAYMYGKSLEALRFRKNDPADDCHGALIWMFNDCWGETGWTTIDYYLRRKPSYYWIRNANSPVKAVVRKRNNQIVTRLLNDTLNEVKTTVHFGWMRADGTDSQIETRPLVIEANGMSEISKENIPADKIKNPGEWIYTAYILKENNMDDMSVWSPVPYREFAPENPEISIEIKDRDIRITSSKYCHGIHYKDNGKKLFSDNYFDLLPGIPKLIKCISPRIPKKISFHTLYE